MTKFSFGHWEEADKLLETCPLCNGKSAYAGSEIFCRECGLTLKSPDYEDLDIEAWNTRAERTCKDQLDGRDPCVFVCSHCEHITDHAEDERPNYCPNCGAKVATKDFSLCNDTTKRTVSNNELV